MSRVEEKQESQLGPEEAKSEAVSEAPEK